MESEGRDRKRTTAANRRPAIDGIAVALPYGPAGAPAGIAGSPHGDDATHGPDCERELELALLPAELA